MRIAGDGVAEWRQYGLMLLPCFVGMAFVSFHGYSLGVMIVPLEQEFGWSRTQITMGNFIIACVSLLLSPMVGRAIDRFGPRAVAIAGVITYAALLSFLSTANSDVFSWWWRWALLGLGSSLILPTVWAASINSVFVQNRGKALAIALMGTGMGAAIVPTITHMLIQAYGWRGAYIGLGCLMGSIVLLLVLLFFRSPCDNKSLHRAAESIALPGYDAAAGYRSAAFWKLALAVFVFGVTILALTVNAVPVLHTRGLERSEAAAIAGLLGIGSVIGRLGGGFLLDRFDARKVAALSVLAPIASMFILLFWAGQSAWLAGAAMLTLGLALGAEVDACSYLAARHFGMRSFGVLFGSITGVVAFGAGIAPVLGNYVYDLFGSYDPMLWAIIPLCVFAAYLFYALGEYPDFDALEKAEMVSSGRLQPIDTNCAVKSS